MLQRGIKINGTQEHTGYYRFAVHHYIREKEVELIIKAIKEFLN